MCGICGIFHYADGARADATVLRAMTDVLTHRGPDDAGHHVEGPVALGMRRLAIIDLDSGQQPIYSEDRSSVIVCNGEIYNFRDIKKRLAGRRFTTSGDIQLSDNANDIANGNGARDGRKAPNAPIPAAAAGALIARVGNGAPFPIGQTSEPVTMPANGILYLGINDDGFADNRGNFQVIVR